MIEEIPKQNKLVAVYARVSSANQEAEGTIETQLSAVNKFITEGGYIVAQQYLDEGWSGDNLIRPALDQLRVDAKKKIFNAVVIYDPDRLARRGAWQEVVIEELKESEVEVLFVTIPPAKTDEDVIMYKMRGVFAEYDRMKIKERFRLGKVRKAKEGHIILTEAPYGFTFVKKNGKRGDTDFEQGHIEINELELANLKKIFSLLVDDRMTLRQITKELQELGIPPRKSKRGVWSSGTLSTILRNETYIGKGYYGSSYAVVPQNPLKVGGYKKIKKTSRKLRPLDERICIPTPKVIDEALFLRAQKQLQINAVSCQRNRKNDYLLSGKIRCSCGHTRAGEGPQHGKHLYYRCTDRVSSYPLPRTCNEKGINARIADKEVWTRISKLMSSPDLMLKQAKRWLGTRQNKVSGLVGDTDLLKKEIAKLKEQEDRYNKAYGSGLFTIEKLKEYTYGVREKISVLENQVLQTRSVAEQTSDQGLPKDSELAEFSQKAMKFMQNLSFEAKRSIITNVLDKVVATQNELQVSGFIPINDLNYVECCRFNWNCWVAKRGEVHAF